MNRNARILIVDDEPNVRLVFRTALESSGYSITTAADGEQALKWLVNETVDLVLLDLQMPGLSGMDVLESMRKASFDVPVVIITAHGNVPNAVQAMKLGAIDFLTKPISPEILRTVVAEVLARHVARTEPPPPAAAHEPVTVAAQFAANLAQAKRALNNRWFEEAEVYLKQAIGLEGNSAEVHNLMGVLHELRNEHDASYRAYRAALKADRHYEPAKHNMQRYYERFTFGKSDACSGYGRSGRTRPMSGPRRGPSRDPGDNGHSFKYPSPSPLNPGGFPDLVRSVPGRSTRISPIGPARRIMIVEDEPNVRLVFRAAPGVGKPHAGNRGGREKRRPAGWLKSRPTWSCSTSGCRASAAWRCSGVSARRGAMYRWSWSPPTTACPTPWRR